MPGLSSNQRAYKDAGKTPVSNIAENSKFVLVNDEDKDNLRYWVGVGPEILLPGYNEKYPNEKATLDQSHFKYGTELDIVLQNVSNAEDKVYIKCICGMVKAHTYPHGIFQTGDPYPYSYNKNEDGSAHRDGSYVEFLRRTMNVDDEENNGIMSKYIVIDIIVYKREW